MSAGRRTSLAAVLMTCAVIATTASAARAQMGEDVPPHCIAPAPTLDAVSPASQTSSFDLGSLRLGLPLQFSASLAAYRWLAPLRSQLENRQAPAVTFAQRGTVRSAWWRKRF
jgi:hypothetical protein